MPLALSTTPLRRSPRAMARAASLRGRRIRQEITKARNRSFFVFSSFHGKRELHMNRNRVMLVVAFAAAGSFILSAAPDTVTIDGGQIAGTAADGVRVFKGIPFAAPPVGGLRWQAPRPVIAWKGVRAADTFG